LLSACFLPALSAVYNDHAERDDDWVEQERLERGAEATTTTGAKKKFPLQLHLMLESVHESGLASIVRWLPHGRAFAVLNKAAFTEVLKRYFPIQTEYSSFQRQLNIYGFFRLARERMDVYYHELFLRGRPAMASLIPRSLTGRYSVRRKYDPGTEPDFDAMVWLPDPTRPVAVASLPSNVSMALTDRGPLPLGASVASLPEAERQHSVESEHLQRIEAHSVRDAVNSHFVGSLALHAQLYSNTSPLNEPTNTLHPGDRFSERFDPQWPVLNKFDREAHADPLHPTRIFCDPPYNQMNSSSSGSLIDAHYSSETNAPIPLLLQAEPLSFRFSPVVDDARKQSADESTPGNVKSATEDADSPTLESIDMPRGDGIAAGATGLNGMDRETNASEGRVGSKLDEWAEFLGDVDLDTSSATDSTQGR
jgi:HSF-type DNA-binding